MSVAKVIEITASSPTGFEDAVRHGVERAGQTVKNIQGAWVTDQQVRVKDGKITEYRVRMRVTFVLE